MKKIKVFLADDHTILRQGLRALLEGDNRITVIGEASTGQDTLDLVIKLKPEVLILDISMGDINGVDIAEYLKKEKPGLKIICLTMYDNEEILYRIYKAGARAYILKDNAAEELLNTLFKIYEHNSIFIAPSFSKNIIEQLEFKYENRKELTKREKEVLGYLVAGKTNKEISQIFFLSVRTVEAHRKNIMGKIQASSTAELIKYAIQKGYVNITK